MQSITVKPAEIDFKKITETMTAADVTTPASQAASLTNKLMMKLLPWCKLKRTKIVFRDSFSCDDISSVIIRSKSDNLKSSAASTINRFFTTTKQRSTSTITPHNGHRLPSHNNTINSKTSSIYCKANGGRTTTLPLPSPPPSMIQRGTSVVTSAKVHNNQQVTTTTTTNQRHHLVPIVNFVNKGEGLVTVDTVVTTNTTTSNGNSHQFNNKTTTNNNHNGMTTNIVGDRILSNDNELYSISMGTASSSAFSSSRSLSNTSCSLSSSKSNNNNRLTIYPFIDHSRQLSSPLDCDNNQLPSWFYGPIFRDAAISILSRQPIGCFLVRESTSKPECYALSLRVPKRIQVSGVAHYLILRNAQGTFKIKGFTKEFTSLHSLIVHHSIMQELLPCTLNLSIIPHRDDILNASLNEDCTKFINDDPMGTNYDNNEEDELVDIDADPDYQRILSQFRRSMANCN
ncbi:uncharacterized protein LOC141857011 [Brevipalpus obovatus]|uniref:uncharacterized protein LOC141857011 n=1 Tax=Brevipalpus obovatus TaxID=246614 RepID=UPI003D9F89F3